MPAPGEFDVLVGGRELVVIVIEERGIDGVVRITQLIRWDFLHDIETCFGASSSVKGEGISQRSLSVVRRFLVSLLRELAAGGGVVIKEEGETSGVGGEVDLVG